MKRKSPNFKYWFYRRVYVPIADLYYRIKERNVQVLPAPCQICGIPGHHERYCPNAYRLGFFDKVSDKKEEG
jgi:hypothetical protein